MQVGSNQFWVSLENLGSLLVISQITLFQTSSNPTAEADWEWQAAERRRSRVPATQQAR